MSLFLISWNKLSVIILTYSRFGVLFFYEVKSKYLFIYSGVYLELPMIVSNRGSAAPGKKSGDVL